MKKNTSGSLDSLPLPAIGSMESLIAEGTADAEVVDDAVEVDDDTAAAVEVVFGPPLKCILRGWWVRVRIPRPG